LEILYTQGDEFDFTSTEISDLGLNAESFEQLMERYIAKPAKDIQLSKGASSVNLTADVIRLKGNINAESAEAFQTMSDLKGKQWVAEMHELVNSDHTKISASQMLFGNALNLDRGLFLPPVERPDLEVPLSDHISKMLRLQDEIMIKAREVLKTLDEGHMALFPEKPTQYQADSYVLVK
jgi:hypothetical protein